MKLNVHRAHRQLYMHHVISRDRNLSAVPNHIDLLRCQRNVVFLGGLQHLHLDVVRGNLRVDSGEPRGVVYSVLELVVVEIWRYHLPHHINRRDNHQNADNSAKRLQNSYPAAINFRTWASMSPIVASCDSRVERRSTSTLPSESFFP